MEYSKDIVLGVNYLGREVKIKDNTLVTEENKTIKSRKRTKDKKANQQKSKILKFMNEHKFITSISITCLALMILDCMLVYSFIELLQRI